MAKKPGDFILFTDDNNVQWGGTVVNAFEDEDGNAVVSVSISGKGIIQVMKESDLDD